jgi:hypothetical protein
MARRLPASRCISVCLCQTPCTICVWYGRARRPPFVASCARRVKFGLPFCVAAAAARPGAEAEGVGRTAAPSGRPDGRPRGRPCARRPPHRRPIWASRWAAPRPPMRAPPAAPPPHLGVQMGGPCVYAAQSGRIAKPASAAAPAMCGHCGCARTAGGLRAVWAVRPLARRGGRPEGRPAQVKALTGGVAPPPAPIIPGADGQKRCARRDSNPGLVRGRDLSYP